MRLLGVGRHLGFFEDHVLPDDWIVLLQLEFALLSPLVLRRVVGKAGARGGHKSNVVTHGAPSLPRPNRRRKRSKHLNSGRLSLHSGVGKAD
jgi:hypothetical protein